MTEVHASFYLDTVTGAKVYQLTTGLAVDDVFYQTHPMWTPGMAHLVFHSNRDGDTRPHALEMASGEIRALVGGPYDSSVLARKNDSLYYIGDGAVRVATVSEAFSGRRSVHDVAAFPSNKTPVGGLTLDANEAVLYAGAKLKDLDRWEILALELKSGRWEAVAETTFQVGHLQANPDHSGVVLFCHETGGDAPQRIWIVTTEDGTPRPFYRETYEEWVTHEAWWGGDRVIFTIWPYDDAHREKPHGILSVDTATETPTLHTQYPAWHTHGSPDGLWAMGDDFDRNIWLVKVKTGERRLLTEGHNGAGRNTHPHGSFTPDNRAIVFNSSRDGSENIALVELPDWTSLPAA